MDSPASCPDVGDVRVWYARPGAAWAAPGARALALEWLTPAERVRYDRYRHDADRDMFLLGRAMARALVGRALGLNPTAWTWRDGARGRPEIGAPDCPLSFNLAHSGGLVVCALARDTQVGVDVEDRARAVLDRQLVARYCSPAERAAIDACGEKGWQDAFLRHWTLKEAYLKARGLGIAVALADLSFAIDADLARGIEGDRVRLTFERSLAGEDPHWAFALAPVGDRHYVAAAVATGNGREPRFTFAPMPEGWLPV
jgi:4'-phosphopantetheinyl transferase